MEHILIGILVVASFAALIWQGYLHRSIILGAQSPAPAAQPAPVVINNHLNAPAPAASAPPPAPPVAQAPTWKATTPKEQILPAIPQGLQQAEESLRSMAAAALDFAKRGVAVSATLEQFNARDAILSAAYEAAYRAYWGI